MELADGSLAQELMIDHTLGGNPHKALFDTLAGLEWIHSQGIYHRDLKPQNILRLQETDGSPRYAISDFGLIKVTASDATTLTATGTQGGTDRYAAPELISNFKRATARSDIFSFGVILFDIFVGPTVPRVPYTEVNFAGAVGSVATKCTKTLPARRYASVAELRAALYDALQHETPHFGSKKEEQIFGLLKTGEELTDHQWDSVFLLLEELDPNAQSFDLLVRAFTKDHLIALKSNAPDLLAAFSRYYIDYVNSRRGGFGFNYCDVIADKLTWLFELGDVGIRASALLALLGLAVSHNRWFVEGRFFRLAGPSLDAPTADRMVMEVQVRGLQVSKDIEHLEWSIQVNRSELSPILHRLWDNSSA
ncbi:hypothetical protein MishRS11D_07520 [Methylomagnum ishizawai]|nr:hypothetical protein MishRS11D_07520 [Methylomagnum ishizawai]